jgi:hypothetical protein
MGISKSPTGIVLALFLWSSAEFAIAKPIVLWTPHGEVQIEKYNRNPQSQQLNLWQAKKIQSNQSGYAYAVFTSVPSADERESIERSGGLKFLSVYDVRANIIIYLVKVTENFGDAAQIVSQSSRRFFNLEPIYPEDKVSRKILAGKGFASGEVDKSGEVVAHVEFFPDVDLDSAKNILKPKKFRKCVTRQSWFEIRTSVDNLRSLAEIPGIMSIFEIDTTAYPTNFQARELTGVNRIQNIDTTINYPPSTAWMAGAPLTGDSVYVGIYDTGIDSLNRDF